MSIVDTLEAGSGPLVVLVHPTASGAHQWRKLMSELEARFHLVAVNLFGYGCTPAWTGHLPQTLNDQADLIEAALPETQQSISIVGHSFGGAVAMKAAARLGKRVGKLVLLEPNPFYLLEQNGRSKAFVEILEIRNLILHAGTSGDWTTATAKFTDYWAGAGTWRSMSDEARTRFAEALKPNLHEWDTVMNETTTLDEWVRSLPEKTLVVSAEQTVRPIQEIIELMQHECPTWRFEQINAGGHMAPLTRPDLVNPIVSAFLSGP